METVRVGISACLLGEPVRYDGAHKLDRFLRDTVGRYVEYVPVCPEVECGLGVPREAMRLEGDIAGPRLVTTRTRRDFTERMLKWAEQRARELEQKELCGFIFKKGSPSCGMERVPVFDHGGKRRKRGVGLFAGLFVERFPLIPVEDDERLHDPVLRGNFIEKMFVFKRWREVLKQGARKGQVIDFHACHELLIMAHSPAHYRTLARLLEGAKALSRAELFEEYQQKLIEALRLKATISKNAKVLRHILGCIRKNLSADEKEELRAIIDRYRAGLLPLIVPVVLLNHYLRKYPHSRLKDQVYLSPHPLELCLKNHP